ncbi:MAG TPA: YsnF/AvaK domain-containing protein [Salinarimonas sp.]|nr:YsnF/AvaK domain-containing protein [Salinarimonas sp.]
MADERRDGEVERIPIVEEEARIEKRVVEGGRVRVHTSVEERQQVLRETLAHEEVSVERVPIDREVSAMPDIREEGDVTVIPVVEEILVVERRLRLKEEIRIRKTRRTEAVEVPVTVRATRATVERE